MTKIYSIDNINGGINSYTFNFNEDLLNTKLSIAQILELWPICRDPICGKTDYAEGYNHCLIDILQSLSNVQVQKS